MPASIRIIKIVKDKNPLSGEEEEAYTAEIECEADNAKDLARELAACPYGEEIMDLLRRAEFIPAGPHGTAEELVAEAKREEEELMKREEVLREEGRKEIREKYINYLKKKRLSKKATEALEELACKENEDVERKAEEEEGAHQSDHERDERLMLPHFGGNPT
jgi:hypothetical protein